MTTGTEPVDELEVPHFKERLRHELVELHAERHTARRRVRRSVRRSAVGAAAAAAVVVGVLASQLVGSPGTDRQGGTVPTTVIVQRVAAATDEALAESVVHSVDEQVAPDGTRRTREMWHDETTGIARFLDRGEDGDPITDVGPLTGPTVESPAYSGQRVVDHCTRRYLEIPDTGEASTNIGAGVVDVRDLLEDGELVADGTEVVDGRELIRLRGTDSADLDYVLLVDPDTYRVVGQRGTLDLGETYSTVYDYLPRTAASLDLLHPPVPAGFTEVDPGDLLHPTESCDGGGTGS